MTRMPKPVDFRIEEWDYANDLNAMVHHVTGEHISAFIYEQWKRSASKREQRRARLVRDIRCARREQLRVRGILERCMDAAGIDSESPMLWTDIEAQLIAKIARPA